MLRLILLSLTLVACSFDYELMKNKEGKVYGFNCSSLPHDIQAAALENMVGLYSVYPQHSICDNHGYILRLGGKG